MTSVNGEVVGRAWKGLSPGGFAWKRCWRNGLKTPCDFGTQPIYLRWGQALGSEWSETRIALKKHKCSLDFDSSLFFFCFNELVISCVTGSMKAHVFNFHIRIDMESSTISPVHRPWDHIERTFVMCSGCIWQDPTRADMRRGRYLNCTRGFVYLSLNTEETFSSCRIWISREFSNGILSMFALYGKASTLMLKQQ